MAILPCGMSYAAQAALHDRDRRGPSFNPVTPTGKQERDAQGGAAHRHKSSIKDLYKLKNKKPHLFVRQDQNPIIVSPSENGIPTGFEFVGRCGWLANKDRNMFLHKADSRYLWFDEHSSIYRDADFGVDLTEELSLSSGAARIGTSCSSGNAPKHVAIMDLHRAADAFKLDISHLDRPSAMLAVYGGTESEISADLVARSFHERLLKHLNSYRGKWSDECLKAVMIQTFMALADSHGADKNIIASVALQLGSRVVTAVSHTGACVVFNPDSCDGSCQASSNSGLLSCLSANATGCHTACVDLAHRGVHCIMLSTLPLEQEVVTAAAAHIVKGHSKAASVRIVKGSAGAAGAAACAKALWAPSTEPSAKRPRLESGTEPAKVRVRQILLKYVGCKQPRDTVRRKPVSRSVAEAEMAMLGVLDEIEAAGSSVDAAFTQHCRALSECSSSLKARDLAGDIGWLTRPIEKAGEKLTKEQISKNALVRTALELKVGELSDILVSDDGVHLFQRIA